MPKNADNKMGVFPHWHIDQSGWEAVRLGDILSVEKGTQLGRAEMSNNGAFPVFNGGTTASGFADDWNTENAIIISEGGNSCGFVNFVPSRFWRGGHCYKVESSLSSGFLFQFLKYHEPRIMALRVGSGLPNIQKSALYRLEVSVPSSTDEQNRIAETLNAADKRLDSLSALLAKQEAIKKTTLSLLMQPKGKWDSITIRAFEPHRNNTCSRALMTSEKGRVKNIHYGDVLIKFPEIVSLKTCDIDYLTEDGVRHAPDDYLQDGDIVIADTAEDETVGKMIEIQDIGVAKVVSGLHTVFLRPPKRLFVRGWLGYWMNSTYYHDQLLPLMTGIKVLSISKTALASSDVFYPPMEEQQRIVKCLTSLDNAIMDTRAAIVKTQQLKQGLMHYFFG